MCNFLKKVSKNMYKKDKNGFEIHQTKHSSTWLRDAYPV